MDWLHLLVFGQEASPMRQVSTLICLKQARRPARYARNSEADREFYGKRGDRTMRAVEQIGLDDDSVRAMGEAFDIACSRLIRASVLDASNVERMQRLAAKHLVHCARRGERDEWRLARRAMFLMCMAAANERLAAAQETMAKAG